MRKLFICLVAIVSSGCAATAYKPSQTVDLQRVSPNCMGSLIVKSCFRVERPTREHLQKIQDDYSKPI